MDALSLWASTPNHKSISILLGTDLYLTHPVVKFANRNGKEKIYHDDGEESALQPRITDMLSFEC